MGARRRYTAVFLQVYVFNRNEPNKRGVPCEMPDELQFFSSSLTHTQLSLKTVEATCGITLVCNAWHAMLKKVASMSITENNM